MGYSTYSTYSTAEKPLISTYSRKLLYQLPTPMMFDPQLRNGRHGFLEIKPYISWIPEIVGFMALSTFFLFIPNLAGVNLYILRYVDMFLYNYISLSKNRVPVKLIVESRFWNISYCQTHPHIPYTSGEFLSGETCCSQRGSKRSSQGSEREIWATGTACLSILGDDCGFYEWEDFYPCYPCFLKEDLVILCKWIVILTLLSILFDYG